MKKLAAIVEKIGDIFCNWNQGDEYLTKFADETLNVIKNLDNRLKNLEKNIRIMENRSDIHYNR